MVWIEGETDLDVLNWSWKLVDKKLVLVMTTMNATSDDILNIIHWNCSTACKTAVAAEDFGYYALHCLRTPTVPTLNMLQSK